MGKVTNTYMRECQSTANRLLKEPIKAISLIAQMEDIQNKLAKEGVGMLYSITIKYD